MMRGSFYVPDDLATLQAFVQCRANPSAAETELRMLPNIVHDSIILRTDHSLPFATTLPVTRPTDRWFRESEMIRNFRSRSSFLTLNATQGDLDVLNSILLNQTHHIQCDWGSGYSTMRLSCGVESCQNDITKCGLRVLTISPFKNNLDDSVGFILLGYRLGQITTTLELEDGFYSYLDTNANRRVKCLEPTLRLTTGIGKGSTGGASMVRCATYLAFALSDIDVTVSTANKGVCLIALDSLTVTKVSVFCWIVKNLILLISNLSPTGPPVASVLLQLDTFIISGEDCNLSFAVFWDVLTSHVHDLVNNLHHWTTYYHRRSSIDGLKVYDQLFATRLRYIQRTKRALIDEADFHRDHPTYDRAMVDAHLRPTGYQYDGINPQLSVCSTCDLILCPNTATVSDGYFSSETFLIIRFKAVQSFKTFLFNLVQPENYWTSAFSNYRFSWMGSDKENQLPWLTWPLQSLDILQLASLAGYKTWSMESLFNRSVEPGCSSLATVLDAEITQPGPFEQMVTLSPINGQHVRMLLRTQDQFTNRLGKVYRVDLNGESRFFTLTTIVPFPSDPDRWVLAER